MDFQIFSFGVSHFLELEHTTHVVSSNSAMYIHRGLIESGFVLCLITIMLLPNLVTCIPSKEEWRNAFDLQQVSENIETYLSERPTSAEGGKFLTRRNEERNMN